MAKTTINTSNMGKPSPRWFRIFKKIFSNTENFVIALLMIMGYSAEAPMLLIIKLSTSFILNNLDTIMANGEVYTPSKEETT